MIQYDAMSKEEKAQPVKRKSSTTRTKKKPLRKAPTRTKVSEKSESRLPVKLLAVIAFSIIIVIGISYVIASSDSGEINVSATVEKRAAIQEQQGDIAGSEATRAAATQAAKKTALPNGGLVGRGDKVTEQQVIEERQKKAIEEELAASSTATSSEEIASSTNGVDGEAHIEVDSTETATSSEATTE